MVRGIAANFYDVSSNRRKVRVSFLQEIRDHRLRRVVPRCTRHAAAWVLTRATQIEPADWHAVIGVSQHRACGKKLIGRHSAMEDIAVGQAEDALQIEWRETLPSNHACFEAGRIGFDSIDHQVGDGFPVLVP